MRKAIETGTDEAAASVAGYIAELTAELARLADRPDLAMLAYFLNLARVEAEFRARELAGPARARRSASDQ